MGTKAGMSETARALQGPGTLSCSESVLSSKFFLTMPGQVPSRTLPTILTVGNLVQIHPLSSAH